MNKNTHYERESWLNIDVACEITHFSGPSLLLLFFNFQNDLLLLQHILHKYLISLKSYI